MVTTLGHLLLHFTEGMLRLLGSTRYVHMYFLLHKQRAYIYWYDTCSLQLVVFASWEKDNKHALCMLFTFSFANLCLYKFLSAGKVFNTTLNTDSCGL